MTEDYVSFEVAKLLKKKGFDERSQKNTWVLAKDRGNEEKYFTCSSDELSNYTYIDDEHEHNVYHVLSIPTQALACKWLREKHGIHIWTDFVVEGNDYIWTIHQKGRTDYVQSDDYNIEEPVYPISEQAIEAALLYTLQNLIK